MYTVHVGNTSRHVRRGRVTCSWTLREVGECRRHGDTISGASYRRRRRRRPRLRRRRQRPEDWRRRRDDRPSAPRRRGGSGERSAALAPRRPEAVRQATRPRGPAVHEDGRPSLCLGSPARRPRGRARPRGPRRSHEARGLDKRRGPRRSHEGDEGRDDLTRATRAATISRGRRGPRRGRRGPRRGRRGPRRGRRGPRRGRPRGTRATATRHEGHDRRTKAPRRLSRYPPGRPDPPGPRGTGAGRRK